MAKQRACLALPEFVQEIDALAGLRQPEVKEPMMRRKGNYRILVLAVALLLGTQAPLGATTIDTYTGWNKSSFILTFGPDNTPTYGQTITVPFGESALTSFTFYLEVAPTVIFRGEVYAWDGTKATGSPLYESAPTHTTQNSTFEAVTFNTGLTSVISGHTYGLFATTSKDTGSGSGVWGLAGDVYSGGGFIHTNNNDYSQWTTEAWEPLRLSDLAFQATFGIAPIPLPGTLLLFGSGLAGLAWLGRRRRGGK
ncbi:MAG: PEP-CTERM sorting domain-containing protein [Desulfobaccales bacterium]